MNISKELKEKLIKANSEEEVKAILGDQATEEEITRTWQEIEHHRPTQDLEAVEDDELEAVSGGADRDFLTDGCSASVECGSHCWSDDSCFYWDVTYDNEQYACTIGYKNHDWGPVMCRKSQHTSINYFRICNRCGKKVQCSEHGDTAL